jgi:hypothetical protein
LALTLWEQKRRSKRISCPLCYTTGYILHGNCLLKHVVERKIEERIKVTGWKGGRRKQLLGDLQETSEYWQLKEGALDCTLWRTCLWRSYRPVVRQRTEWTNILTGYKNIKIKIHRIIILPVSLYGCETLSLTLTEENRLFRNIFGPKRDNVTGKWRKLHSEELNGLHSSPNVIRGIKCVVCSMYEGRGA